MAGLTNFYDNSTADHATFTNNPGYGSAVIFYGNSTAGNATITNEGGDYYLYSGVTAFLDTSTAADGLFIANGSLTNYYGYSLVRFWDSSKAGNGTVIANGGQVRDALGGLIELRDFSTAENGTFIANGTMVSGAFGGRMTFDDDATASAATLMAKGGVGSKKGRGGGILFNETSTGDTTRVELHGNGFLDLRGHDTPGLTIGSLEGDGLVFLGGANLSVGSNNFSTKFSGLIEEASEAVIGALTKIGTASLTLTGANTYTGGTTIEGGKLVVNNMGGSGTGSGAVQVNAGVLGGRGTIAGIVAVGTGGGPGAALGPGRRGGKPDALTIQSELTFNSDATYNCGLNTKGAKADQVVANGVTINGARFSLLSRGGLTLPAGTVLTVIDNIAATPIAGTFANLPDGSTFTTHGNTFQVNYEGGDGNDLTLAAVP
jgi:autotransporter-associated beta strand protein